ncbi:MAG: hypothetical protein ACKOCT_01045 [Alphaproteobacteria bacterium]
MTPRLPEGGTLVISSLLVLALVFAGTWIAIWADPHGNPNAIIPWFLSGAGAICAIGILVFLFRGRA